MTAEKRLGKSPNVRKLGSREVIVIFEMLPDFMFRTKTSIRKLMIDSQDRVSVSLAGAVS